MADINKSISSEEIKEIVFRLGADLCGIAPVGRFKERSSCWDPVILVVKV